MSLGASGVRLPHADANGRLARALRAAVSVSRGEPAGGQALSFSAAVHLSRNTIRTHVARVLGKAGVRTQAQFVSLVLRGPAPLTQPAS